MVTAKAVVSSSTSAATGRPAPIRAVNVESREQAQALLDTIAEFAAHFGDYLDGVRDELRR